MSGRRWLEWLTIALTFFVIALALLTSCGGRSHRAEGATEVPGGLDICRVRLLWGVVAPEPYVLSLVANYRRPSPSSFIEADASKAACVSAALSKVAHVLLMGGGSEVVPATVETVSVDMVNVICRVHSPCTPQKRMEAHRAAIDPGHGIDRIRRMGRDVAIPVVVAYCGGIRLIDDRHAAPREHNEICAGDIWMTNERPYMMERRQVAPLSALCPVPATQATGMHPLVAPRKRAKPQWSRWSPHGRSLAGSEQA